MIISNLSSKFHSTGQHLYFKASGSLPGGPDPLKGSQYKSKGWQENYQDRKDNRTYSATQKAPFYDFSFMRISLGLLLVLKYLCPQNISHFVLIVFFGTPWLPTCFRIWSIFRGIYMLSCVGLCTVYYYLPFANNLSSLSSIYTECNVFVVCLYSRKKIIYLI